MNNWLKEFIKLFPDATERYISRVQKLDELEKKVKDARETRIISSATLRTIETHKSWNYPWWWPRMSKQIRTNIQIPEDLSDKKQQRKVISDLYEAVRHIEVVSVVLRFICPEYFGIISPPVIAFLHLTPKESSISYYEKYLDVLNRMRSHYELERVADVDMGLWSAAHLSYDLEYMALAEEISQDMFFQQLLLENALDGWDWKGSPDFKKYMIFSRVLIKHEYRVSAVITAKAFENMLYELASRLGAGPGSPKMHQSKRGAPKDSIKRSPNLHKFSISPEDVERWWEWRNDAVHGDRQISQKNAQLFEKQISTFIEKNKL